MEDYKKKLGNLASKIKNEPTQTPIQQVQPVKACHSHEVRKKRDSTTGYLKDLKGKLRPMAPKMIFLKRISR